MFQLNTLLFVIVFSSYYFLLKNIDTKRKYIFLFTFIFFSLIIKLIIPLSEIRDFFTYTRVLSDKGHMNFFFVDILYEPYFLFLSKILLTCFSIFQVLSIYYFLLFILSISFFIWLAYLKDISFWKKYFLFNLFFILFTFILLRNGIAYMMIAMFFYYLSKDRFIISFFTALFFHITTIPVLFLSFLRKKSLNYYIIPLVIVMIFLFFYLFLNESSLFFLKYKDFKKNSVLYNHTVHNIVFSISISIFISYLIIYKNKLLNYFYVLLLFLYVILFYFNAVMGFRFSFYIFLYLFMHTKLMFSSKADAFLNKYSILFITLGIITVGLFLFV